MGVRIQTHSSPLDFLRTVAPFPFADSGRTNLHIGFVVQRWLYATPVLAQPEQKVGAKPDTDEEVLVTVWQDEQLCLMFSKLGWAQCKLVSPLAPPSLADIALPLIPQLTSYLLTLSPFSSRPELLRSITGPHILVDAFLSHWPAPRKVEPSMWMCPMAASVAPSSPLFPPGHSFERIKDIQQVSRDELEQLARLLIGFYTHNTAPKLTLEQAVDNLCETVPAGAMWVYRAPATASSLSPSLPVAFVTTGRPTLRTVAIRGVFVAASHRRQGIAERMVAAVTRAHLVDAPPLLLSYDKAVETDDVEEEKTKWGGKEEVCLFVEPGNPGARAVYERARFVKSEVLWCDVDLEGIEPGHW
ncbi:hypothetical protein JCM8547_007861 [Rhodosporidiobolus lusitaniae]